MRQVVLDTETTGLEASQGHRIIEIGCVELVNRKLTGNHYQQYINPEREIDAGAFRVHGITDEFLQDKPVFANIADDFLDFVRGAELIIHNAAFDIEFLNHELGRIGGGETRMEDVCQIVDSIAIARHKHPGQRNSLDALCRRYGVDNSQRTLHGALLDAEILADVFLAMSGGQTAFQLAGTDPNAAQGPGLTGPRRLSRERPRLRVIRASAEEESRNREMLDLIASTCPEAEVLAQKLLREPASTDREPTADSDRAPEPQAGN